MTEPEQCCGTCVHFRKLNGKSGLGPVPMSTGECRHSPPSVICLAKPATVQTLNPKTQLLENRTVMSNEIKTIYTLVDEKDPGCAQYQYNWNQDGTEF